ncbi:methyltransferase domain-containing protein [Oceanibacterium hippocampi]|uniref:Methyltransferase type 11 domain-containing protein n=1 Tax=Oceanibacterium hippocampi TaxID=745714 RepID=A0A1Y5RVB2_9PROT|nr:methyltransferase domain-containing protein [Oceanibacterium hippocampi]SLN26213.1 hypothetical protein OCH7691_00802 [Oceanibacterium hippocampi]
MLRADVIDLRNFYDGNLGRVTRRILQARVREVWPNVRGLNVLGLGYATPFLRGFREEAERVLAIMPATQGVIHWPPEGPCAVALAEEMALPLPDASMDRVLMVHALENTEAVRPLLREAWRVLAPGGRLLAIVPNRLGLWSRIEGTPFGQGFPYSPPQLDRVLRENMFSPRLSSAALYMPPSRYRFILRSVRAWETVGGRLAQALGGVLVIEADKQVFAVTGPMKARRLRRPVVIASGRPAAAGRSLPPALTLAPPPEGQSE